jgi:uncharacterized membrane protein
MAWGWASAGSSTGFSPGCLILGWRVFNLVEGIIDHHILGLHHVRDMPAHVPLYDRLFLGIGGVGSILLAWIMARTPVTVKMQAVPAGHRA